MRNQSETSADTRVDSRRATFRANTHGMRAYTIAQKLRVLRPGIDLRGMTKGAIRDEFASGLLANVSGSELRRALS